MGCASAAALYHARLCVDASSPSAARSSSMVHSSCALTRSLSCPPTDSSSRSSLRRLHHTTTARFDSSGSGGGVAGAP
eukprot:2840870-Pleurochrysis_carterae.AAC.3